MRNHWTEIEKYLEDQKIAQELIGELRDFHMRYTVENQVKERVEKPDILFYGKKILEMSIAALLQGDNLLLSGAKATGKNVLCETLAWIFGRPEYDISFHVNTDSADLIGTDTFINNEVRLRKGPMGSGRIRRRRSRGSPPRGRRARRFFRPGRCIHSCGCRSGSGRPRGWRFPYASPGRR